MIKIVLAIAVMCLAASPIPAERIPTAPGGAGESPASYAGQTKADKRAEKERQKNAKMLCVVVGTFIQSASLSFSDIKSSRDFDDSNNQWVVYESAITFPGAKHCWVYTDRETASESFVTCRMAVPPDKASGDAFKKWNDELISSVKPCLPRGWTPHTDDQPHPEGYFSMEEGSPGPRIEIGLAPAPPGRQKELLINFYRR